MSEKFQQGVSCPYCFDKTTPEQKARYEERERQIQLSRKRGEEHIGGNASRELAERKKLKRQLRAEQIAKSQQGY